MIALLVQTSVLAVSSLGQSSSTLDPIAARMPPAAAALIGVLLYAASCHFLFWARNRYRWTRAVVDFLARTARQDERVVLIWAWIADALAVVFLFLWWRS